MSAMHSFSWDISPRFSSAPSYLSFSQSWWYPLPPFCPSWQIWWNLQWNGENCDKDHATIANSPMDRDRILWPAVVLQTWPVEAWYFQVALINQRAHRVERPGSILYPDQFHCSNKGDKPPWNVWFSFACSILSINTSTPITYTLFYFCSIVIYR